MSLGQKFLHHCVAHPLVFVTRDAKWAGRFHDWTAKRAWPEEIRTDAPEGIATSFKARGSVQQVLLTVTLVYEGENSDSTYLILQGRDFFIEQTRESTTVRDKDGSALRMQAGQTKFRMSGVVQESGPPAEA